jgi:hypothetical protein
MSENTYRNPLLETAWQRFAALDENAASVQKQYMRLRQLTAFLGVLAVLFAILVDNFTDQVPQIVGIIFRVFLILTPIVISVIAAFSNKFQQGQKYLSSRAAAEGILKEIYLYRTVNKNAPNRDKLLSNRLATLQRNLYRSAGGELTFAEFTGDLPPYYDPADEKSDPGFNDLKGDEYLVYRLEHQLDWHSKENMEMQRDRKRIQLAILIFGGIGAFLAAWGGGLAIWVALTAAISSALIGWEELRGLDMRVGNYSQVILELNIIRDWWLTLRDAGTDDDDAAQLATKTERILFDQNLEWVSAMQKALADADSDEVEFAEYIIEAERAAADRMQEKLYSEIEESLDERLFDGIEGVGTSIDDDSDSLIGMFTEVSSLNEDEYEYQLDDDFEDVESAVTPSEETEVMLYEPEDDSHPQKSDSSESEASADSSIFSGTDAEGIAMGFSDEALEAEKFVADVGGEALGEEFDDEDFSDHQISAEDEFVDEDFGDQNDEFEGEGDFEEEVWDDEV